MDDKKMNKLIMKITFIVIGIIFLIWALFNLSIVNGILNGITKILKPFFIGTIIALLLNAPVNFFQRKLTKKDKNGKIVTRKELSVVLSILCIIAVIIILLAIVIPGLANVGKIIVDNIPTYKSTLTGFIDNASKNTTFINLNDIKVQLENGINNLTITVQEQFPQIITNFINAISGTINNIVSFFIGVGFAVILLMERDKIIIAIKKILYTYLKKERANKTVKTMTIFTESFSNFVVAQSINSLIIGIICIVIGLITGVPYAIPLGILVGITSIIPMFGAIIGIFISLIILLAISPIHAIIFLIISIIAWQLGENFIKPNLIGKKVGMPGILQFIAAIGGGLAFGFLGMIFTIPVVNTIYILIREKTKDTIIEPEQEKDI